MRQAAVASRMSARYGARFGARARLSGETGYVDVTGGPHALDTTGSVTLLNTVAQGASVNQRVGKKVALKSLQIRGHARNNSTATDNDVAYLIVYDKRPTGTLPAVTDILVSANSAAFNNDANSGRFRIISRWDAALLGNNTAAANLTESFMKSCDTYIPLKGLPTVYKAAATGAIGDIEEGALYLVTVGWNVAGTAAASLYASTRLRFVDV